MTCPQCEPWIARSWRQWQHRQNNLRAHPHVRPYECPQCGSAEWVLAHPPTRQRRDHSRLVTVIVAVTMIVAIALVMLVLTGHVRAETRILKDDMGREISRATTRGSTTVYEDDKGREIGRSKQDRNGVIFYDAKGREVGRIDGGKKK